MNKRLSFEDAISKGKSLKARERLLVYIVQKKGRSIRQIGACTNHYTIIWKWLVRVRNNGLRGRYDIPNEGCKCFLDELMANLLNDIDVDPLTFGFETELWTAKLITAHIERFGISYMARALPYLLRKYGFSWRKLAPYAQNHP